MDENLNANNKVFEQIKKQWIWLIIYGVAIIFFAIDADSLFLGNQTTSATHGGGSANFVMLWTFVFFAIVFVQVFTTPIPLPPSEALSPDKRIIEIEKIERLKSEQRQRWMIFSYGFMLVSMLGVLYVLSIGWANSAATRFQDPVSPIAVLLGCSKDKNARDVQCPEPVSQPKPPGDQPALTSSGSWVINIGGYVSNIRNIDGKQLCTNGICEISGGIVVPLYVIFIALMGGSVSLTRRLPEYQVQAHTEYVATEKHPKLGQHQFREYLIFQIVQFISAPLLAILAYYLVEPDKIVNTVVLSFIAGFSSETILLMIRGVADKLMPSTGTAVKVGSITGVVTLDSKPAEKVEVSVAAKPNLRTTTDKSGHYVIGNIPIGEHAINFVVPFLEPNEPLKKTESVKIETSQAVATRNVDFTSPK